MASEASAWLPASGADQLGHELARATPARTPPARTRKPAGRHATPKGARGEKSAPVAQSLAGGGDGPSTDPGGQAQPEPRRQRSRGRAWFLLHPLTLICAIQTAGCLALIWSNTAFTDEADYLRLGHLIIAHWLHGTSWPAGYGRQGSVRCASDLPAARRHG